MLDPYTEVNKLFGFIFAILPVASVVYIIGSTLYEYSMVETSLLISLECSSKYSLKLFKSFVLKLDNIVEIYCSSFTSFEFWFLLSLPVVNESSVPAISVVSCIIVNG